MATRLARPTTIVLSATRTTPSPSRPRHAHFGVEAVADTLAPLQAKAERDVCFGVHFCRGPPPHSSL